MGVWGLPTVEGQPHVLLVFWVKSKHEGLGVFGEHQVANMFCAILWKRKPLGETEEIAQCSFLTGEEIWVCPGPHSQSVRARGSPHSYCAPGPVPNTYDVESEEPHVNCGCQGLSPRVTDEKGGSERSLRAPRWS